MEKCQTFRISGDKAEKAEDVVAEEIPLTILANNEEIVTLLASPQDLEELAVGFFFTSGLITKSDDISKITVDSLNWIVYLELEDKKIDPRIISKRMFTSGCGRGILFYNALDIMHKGKKRRDLRIERGRIFRLMKDFQASSAGFNQTGGVHSAALADRENILTVREDIGRHNAVDKIIGYAIMNRIDLNDKIVLSSGRISSEVLFKIQKIDSPVVVSRSAPTNQAVRHAKDSDITLIGFARGMKMNVYSGRHRIL